MRVLHCLVALLLAMSPAVARIKHRELVALLDQGSLDGIKLRATFSYDDTGVTARGDCWLTLLSFDFELEGVHFNRQWIDQGGQVVFHNGVIENVTASFQGEMPAGSPVRNITFGFGGPGVIGYVDDQGAFGHGTFMILARFRPPPDHNHRRDGSSGAGVFACASGHSPLGRSLRIALIELRSTWQAKTPAPQTF